MKKQHFLRTLALLLPAGFLHLYGQDFVNGSFEQNGGKCLLNASSQVFNANMKGVYSHGDNRKPDIMGNTCDHGSAQDGNWFIGLASNISGEIRSESVNLLLSSALQANKQYALSFYTRSRGLAPNLEIGVSSSDSAVGVNVYTVAAEQVTGEWKLITLRFTAPVSGKYISVKAVNNKHHNSGVWLDHFQLRQVFQTDDAVVVMPAPKIAKKQNEEMITKTTGAQPEFYPNPSAGTFKINAEGQDIISMTVFNMLGESVYSFEAVNNQPAPEVIDLNEQQPGMYFVELATPTGKVTKRLIVSR